VATAHIAYEITTGRILLLHHFAAEPAEPELDRREAMELSELSEDQVAVISVAAAEVEATRLYRVDVDRKALVEAEAGEGGVGFTVASTRAPTEAEGAGGSPYTPGTA
jgi:hypothetical protein